jgi:hypothetical protein
MLCAIACQTDERPRLTHAQLLDPQSCKECHPKHYEEWSGSMHAYASRDPVFRAMNRRGQESTAGALADFCVNCHAPMAVREDKIRDYAAVDEIPQHLQGVTCYFCHSVTGVENDSQHFNAKLTFANDDVMRGALRDPPALEPTAHGVKYSEHHDRRSLKSSTVCGTCHDIITPAGVHLERTFKEYSESVFAQTQSSRFQSCQSCHMKSPSQNGEVAVATGRPGETVTATRPLHEHLWPGVDVALTPFPHAEAMRSAVAKCMLTKSISVFEVTLQQRLGFPFMVTVETEAGHSQPSGAAQDRRMWMEILAYDASGAEVYREGVVPDGEVEETSEHLHPWMLRDRMFDADRQETHMFWEAASYDSKLLPALPPGANVKGSDHWLQQEFNPRLREPAARIDLELRIRPMGIDVLQDLVASGHLAPEIVQAMPTFSVARAEATYSKDDLLYYVRRIEQNDCDEYHCLLDPSGVDGQGKPCKP